jgi:hypothetical protein
VGDVFVRQVINKNNNLRKNISINSDDFYILSSFAKKVGISFSELVRKATLKYVEEYEKLDLSDFLRANYPFASDKEEAELAEILKTLDLEEPGKELNLADFL